MRKRVSSRHNSQSDPDEVALCCLHDYTLEYLTPWEVITLSEVSKLWYSRMFGDYRSGSDIYLILSKCIGFTYSLYIPWVTAQEGDLKQKAHRIWKMRNKWTSRAEGFSIKVLTRFRQVSTPIPDKSLRMTVPLHQRLLILKNGEQIISDADKEPEQYRDALLGSLMSDPVKLPDSCRICDRKVIEAHLRTSSTDPFTQRPLSVDQLVPCPELKHQIKQYKDSQLKGELRDKFNVTEESMKQISEKVGEKTVGVDVLQIMIDAQAAAESVNNKSSNQSSRCDGQNEDTDNSESTAVTTTSMTSAAVAPPQGRLLVQNDVNYLDYVDVTESDTNSTRPSSLQEVFNCSRVKRNLEKRTRDKPKIIEISNMDNKVVAYQPGKGIKQFIHGKCFDQTSRQSDIYSEIISESILMALNGSDSTVMCYGQTGSGKTYTMFGSHSDSNHGVAGELLVNLVQSVHEYKSQCKETTITLTANYLQVYGKEALCLLSGSPISIYHNPENGGLVLKGASESNLENTKDCKRLLNDGESRKVKASTKMNSSSSRSHSVIIISIEQINNGKIITSRLTLCDLAGSERVDKSGVVGQHLKEAIQINTSLHTLGRCINGLARGSHHLPFLDTRLTTLLRGSLTRSCCTFVIVCCRPDDEHASESLQSLVFGETCASIPQTILNAALDSKAALNHIDTSLKSCRNRLDTLQPNSDAHTKLSISLRLLSEKREALQK